MNVSYESVLFSESEPYSTTSVVQVIPEWIDVFDLVYDIRSRLLSNHSCSILMSYTDRSWAVLLQVEHI